MKLKRLCRYFAKFVPMPDYRFPRTDWLEAPVYDRAMKLINPRTLAGHRGLKEELVGLLKNLAETEERLQKLSNRYWLNGGDCCPNCGVRGYEIGRLKQIRRVDRVRQIVQKLEKIR